MITSFADVQAAARRGNVIPVTLEFPADLLTPVSAYLRLARAGHRAFLLESVEGGERLARYSFLGADPFETLTIRDSQLVSERGPSGRLARTPIAGNPLAAIAARMATYRSARREGLPPFAGGAVGFMAYECARYLEKIPAPAERASPVDARLMLFGSVVAFDHVRHSVILISNIFTEHNGAESLRAGYARAGRELARLRRALSRQVAGERPLELDTRAEADLGAFDAAMGRARFSAAVGQVKERIRAGDIFQCVLSDQFKFALRGTPFDVYRALRIISPAPYLFHLEMGDETLLGASPEMLTRVADGLVEMAPIAGTRPRGRDLAEDRRHERNMLASVKERAEHLMLVDLGRNDVGRVARPGSVRVRDFMHVERFSHVMHLVSNVEGRLKAGKSAWDALYSCFPAGTLSGAPKIRAQEIIAGLEPVQRGPYGGAVVYCDFSGRLDSCITIRSLYVRGRTGVIRAGAGLVADSQAAREYDEVMNKTRALRRAIGAAGAIAPSPKRKGRKQ